MKEIRQFFLSIVKPTIAKRLTPLFQRVNTLVAGSELSIRKKLLYSFLSISVIPLTLIGILIYTFASNELMEKARDNLQAVGEKKAEIVEDFFEECMADLAVLGEVALTIQQQALAQLENTRDTMIVQIKDYLNSRLSDINIMSNDPTIFRAFLAFESAGSTDGNLWRSTAEKYGPWMSLYKETYGFLNVYLVSKNGRILYSVDKKSDLGENLNSGSLKESPAGKAFQKGLQKASIQDFEPYTPLNNLPAGFVSAPIRSGKTVLGVILGQLAVDPINQILHRNYGMSEKTEAYIVGKSGEQTQMRSKREITNEDVGDSHPDLFMDKAFAGASATETEFDEHGVFKMVSYAPITLPGIKWAIDITTPMEDIFTRKYPGAEADWLTYFKEEETFANFSLVSPEGFLFYAVIHEDDYQTNLLTGPYKDTNLGRLINQTMFTRKIQISDFEKYSPSNNLPAGFAALPVVIKNELIFTVVAQIPTFELQEIMDDYAGLGETGESYLVGADNLWRTDSRFLEEIMADSTVLNPRFKIDPDYVGKAISGLSEVQTITNYRGRKVLSAHSTVTIQPPNTYSPNGIKWAIFSEMDLIEIRSTIFHLAWISMLVVLLTALAVIGLSYVLSKGFTMQIDRIMQLFSDIGIGNYSARAAVINKDELGDMAISMNAMLDSTLTLIQSQEERDAMQTAVMKLLDEISALTGGDLTVRAEVTEHITGAIADSFNAMAEQLTEIIRGVKDATLRVGYTSSQVSEFTGRLASMSEKQSNQVKKAIAVINDITASIQQIAEKATLSAAVSKQSVESAKKGAKAVEDTNLAMNNIRERVQETARAIKRLGESSQEIGNIIQIINDISDRTSILSLNASIQAATAGEAGHGFAVVAEEVQRLAERSSMSTKQIEILVKNIQTDIKEAGRSMDESIQRVVEGSSLANDAHSTLQEIETISSQVAKMVYAISQVSKEQAVASETATRTMTAVGEISTQTSKASKQTALSMQIMSKIAERLRVSVETFKVEDKEIEIQDKHEPIVRRDVDPELEDQQATIAQG